MKDIKNVQEAYDIELTEAELDQVQGGIAVAPVLAGVAVATVLRLASKIIRISLFK